MNYKPLKLLRWDFFNVFQAYQNNTNTFPIIKMKCFQFQERSFAPVFIFSVEPEFEIYGEFFRMMEHNCEFVNSSFVVIHPWHTKWNMCLPHIFRIIFSTFEGVEGTWKSENFSCDGRLRKFPLCHIYKLGKMPNRKVRDMIFYWMSRYGNTH